MTQLESNSALVRHLFEWAGREPERVAIVDRQGGSSLTFAELRSRIEDLAKNLDFIEGPVALSVANEELVPWFFAARHAGLTVALMDAQLKPAEKRAECRRLGIPYLIHQEMAGCGKRGQGPVRVEDLEDAVVADLAPHIEIVKLTSGSTGQAGGTCFGEQELITGVRQIGCGMGLSAADRVLLLLPLTHSYGFDNGPLSLALLGTTLILDRRMLPGDVVKAVLEERVTVLPLVPPLVRVLGHAPWPEATCLRRVICAGGHLPAAFAEAFQVGTGLPVHNFFGSSETGGIAFETHPDEPEALGAVGFPLPGVRIELAEDGEVRVHSAANRRAVWGRDHLFPIGSPVVTGDLAEWTPEGRLRLTGRTSERLNIGGRKVAAAEIESALRALPEVTEAAVIGLADEMRGDRVAAFLVAQTWPVDLTSIPARIRPRETYRLAELPLTGRGKLDRNRLKKKLEHKAEAMAESTVG